MEAEVPFSKALSVFTETQRRIEDAVEAYSPGAADVGLSFTFMAETHEYRRVVALFLGAHGSPSGMNFYLSKGKHSPWPAARSNEVYLELGAEDEKTLTDLLCLGACLGFWEVLGLISASTAAQPAYGLFGPIGPTPVTPLSILLAFEGGALEEAWPNRAKHLEDGWFRWQAKFATVRADDDKPTPYETERSVWDTPEYL